MISYKRIPFSNGTVEGFRYLKDNRLTKERTVPHDVIDKFEYTDTVSYDERPLERRCLFCDAPQEYQRYFQSKTIELCNWHYHNLNLGKIAQFVRELEAEQAKQAQIDALKPKKRIKRRKTTWQEKAAAKTSTGVKVTDLSPEAQKVEVQHQTSEPVATP